MECQEIQLSEIIIDIAAGPFGSKLKTSCFVDDGFPIIDGANLKGFNITDNITKFVTEEKAHSLHRSIAKRGDIVVTISGTLGQIAYIPYNSKYEKYLCSQRQFRVTFDNAKVYVPYLAFYFHTYEGQHKILSFANQVGVPALSQPLKNFRQITIQLPNVKTQKKIASIIELINGKIEQNKSINNNLEQQAQAIFDNMSGKRKPNGKLANIILENPKSKIKVCNVNGVGGRYPFFTSGQAILKYMSPLTNGRNCYLNTGGNADVKFFIGEASYSTDTWCICGKDQTSDYLYLLLKCMGSELNDVYFEGSALKHLQKQSLKDRDIYIPSADELKQFNALVIPMFDLISKNNTDNSLLAETRDLLLPKLMSGELDVSGVDL